MSKLEPIRVGVEGIAPKPIELAPARPARIDWAHLFGLPPFQMYAIERARKSAADVMAWMPAWARKHESEQGCSMTTVTGTQPRAAGRMRRRWARSRSKAWAM